MAEFFSSVVSAIIRIVGKKVPINIVPKAKAVVIFFIFFYSFLIYILLSEKQ
ncbi:hypothetical protein LMG8520_0323 [Lactococcus lactis subsp. lactis]|uniref:Uncharacterized protein n=2 Tax=Lactococcus lactis TaxID=1358 RepID=A0A2A5SBZ8_LACLH|nr:hypothetical protein LMG8520_0323 [Lactococcus lactis subsp. lactis]PCS11047.1 hypothetical protein RU90_GL001077 [Lactococcus lactis subsp. hordniae]